MKCLINTVRDWGYPMPVTDIISVVAYFVAKQGQEIKEWRSAHNPSKHDDRHLASRQKECHGSDEYHRLPGQNQESSRSGHLPEGKM